MNNNTTTHEKREKLMELSAQAKKIRQKFIDNARTAEETAFWASRTINYMLLHHVYSDGGDVRFDSFDGWKSHGATIRRGAKAVAIWGQPRQGVATMPTAEAADKTPAEYEYYPLCFLFSEDDVYFTDAEQQNDKEPTDAAPASPAVPMIDNSTFDEI